MSDEQILESLPNCTRCGYVTLVGRPNVGKSTLLNRILKETISIVTAKPQTTRNRILAVHTEANTQIIFLDTPGFHTPKGPLGKYMVESAEAAIEESDVCLWLLDVSKTKDRNGLNAPEKAVGKMLTNAGRPVFALLNKIDILKDKRRLLPIMAELNSYDIVQAVFPVSALRGDGLEELLGKLKKKLPEGPMLYPEDMISEQAERFFVSEMIRKALTELTMKELPYQSAVVVDKFVEEVERCVVHATIHVERKGQRAIVLGNKGSMIKEIGTRARTEMEAFLSCPVDLRLHVEVSPGWTKSSNDIRKMGYE